MNMNRLLDKFNGSDKNIKDLNGNNNYEYDNSDSDSDSSSSSSSSSASEDRFRNDGDYYRTRTMSNKGLMINIPNYLTKLTPTTSTGSGNDVSNSPGDVKRGRDKSLSQKIKDNNLLVNNNINNVSNDSLDNALSNSPIDIPIEFKEIIKSRSNSISRTRTNSLTYNENTPVINNINNTIIAGNRTRGNSLKSNAPSLHNLRNIPSSMESINSINSFKRSSSSILSNSNASSQIPMKNLKKYLTTGDEAYLADGNGEEDSDEDLFMNNLYHQQQRKQQQDLMVNMTSSANLYALDEAEETVDEEEIERIRRETKKVDPSRSSTLGKVDSIDIDMGLNFGSHLLKATGSNNLSSDSNLKANNSKQYKKITPIDLYGDSDEIKNEDDKENDYIPSSSWFLGGNT